MLRKRGVASPMCDNCKGPPATGQSELVKNSSGQWCTAECYLSYMKLHLQPIAFARLRSDMSDELGCTLHERPPRTELIGFGGTMILEAYHNSSIERPVGSFNKRPKTQNWNFEGL